MSGICGICLFDGSGMIQKLSREPIGNENSSVKVVLDGVIDNGVELRAELTKRGHRFSTLLDAEVLVHLYEDFGIEAIHRLEGGFVFSLWDEKKKILFLVRDRAGIKPLFYKHEAQKFVFASSLAAIQASIPENPQIDEESFLSYLGLAYVPAPRSFFQNVKKLLPGHWLSVRQGNLKIHQYWDPLNLPQSHLSHDTLSGEMTLALKRSVEKQNRIDVPVAFFLNGNFNSSVCAVLYSQKTSQKNHSFSVGFEGEKSDDLDSARQIAKICHSEHHEFTLSASEALAILHEIVPLLDEPIADFSMIPFYYLSLRARELGIQIVLSGSGADEIFLGHPRNFRRGHDLVAGKLSFLPVSWVFNLAHSLGTRWGDEVLKTWDKGVSFALTTSGTHLRSLSDVMTSQDDFLRLGQILKAQFSYLSNVQNRFGCIPGNAMIGFSSYLADDILGLFDKTTAAASMEGRAPLLDHRIVELVFSDPHLMKDIKKISGAVLPQEVFKRKNSKCATPLKNWVCGPWHIFIMDRLLQSQNPLLRKFFDRDRFYQKIKDCKWMEYFAETLFALYVFDLWYEARMKMV